MRQATGTFSRKKLGQTIVEGAPYKPEDVIAGRYRVRDIAGAGPLGFVFRVVDQEVDVEVALKLVNPRLAQAADERRQFVKVLRAHRKVVHPNVCRLYEEGEHEERPYYTSQFLDGLTLRKIIDLRQAKGQFFSAQEIEPILAQVVGALEALHVAGPHGNLKPENVIVLPDLLKLTDFGVGLALPRLPFVQALKARRADAYLAPEVVDLGDCDARADIYALGVILAEMLTGDAPRGEPSELLGKNPDASNAVERVYRRAVSPSPSGRFRSAREFMEALSAALGSSAPPLKSRVESAVGATTTPQRPPRDSAGLQLVRSGPEESVVEPISNADLLPDDDVDSVESAIETLPADATQPLDPKLVPLPLSAPSTSAAPTPSEMVAESQESLSGLPREGRRSTQRLDPPPLFASVRGVTRLAEIKEARHKKATLRLTVLTVSGLLLGSGLGWGWKAWRGPKVSATAARAAAAPLAAAAIAAQADSDKDKNKVTANTAVPAAEPGSGTENANGNKAGQGPGTGGSPLPSTGGGVAVGAVAPTPVAGPRCPDGMKLVPQGKFLFGTPKDDPMMGFDESRLVSMSLPGFCIDQFEYPNRRGVQPAVSVTWHDAKRLCEARGKRLCSEAEWEKACKGPNNWRFPYGSTFQPEFCNTEDESGADRALTVSGRFTSCRSGYGVVDLSGNVAEWTSSPYAAGTDRAQKGGAFARPDYAARCSARKNGAPTVRSDEVGFRCCAEPGL